MADWIAKLDDFLRLGERDILEHAGKVSHDVAVARAESEYERFSALAEGESPHHLRAVELDLREAHEQFMAPYAAGREPDRGAFLPLEVPRAVE